MPALSFFLGRLACLARSAPEARSRFLVLAAVLVAAGGCSDNPVGPTPEDPIARVTVTAPTTFLLGVGEDVQASAVAHRASGAADSQVAFEWTSSDPAVATVDAAGRVTATGVGTARIQASVQAVQGHLEVEVYPVSGEGIDSIDDALVAFMREREVPGGAFTIVRNGKLVMVRGLGYRDLASGEPVEPSTRFRIASVSKSITAVAVLKLIEEGTLSPEARAFDILAELVPSGGPADPRLLDITIDQLLHHTAGWDNALAPDPMFNQRAVAQTMGVPSPPSAETIVRYLAQSPLQYTPGARHSYHNVSYLVLGRVIEAVTGQTYEAYTKQSILAPMDITQMQIAETRRSDRASGEATYYDTNTAAQSIFPGEPGPVAWPYGAYDIVPMDSHGGWIASAVDLARFGVAVDGELTVPDFLGPTQQAYMTQNTGYSYGAGWFLTSATWSHGGSLPGTTAVIWIRQSGTFITAVLNTRQGEGTTDLYNDMLVRFLTAVNGVSSWPDRDLFDAYP